MLTESNIEYSFDTKDKSYFRETFDYRCTHLKTGKTGMRKIHVNSRSDFLELLARWNRSSDDWKYDEA